MYWQQLKLGINPYQNRPFQTYVRDNSMMLIMGRPRTGKTQIGKNVYCQMNRRTILTFDYSGEHSLSRFSNCFSRSKNWSQYLPRMVSIKDVGYPISYYDDKSDWLSLGLSPGAAQIVSQLAHKKQIHHNEWKT